MESNKTLSTQDGRTKTLPPEKQLANQRAGCDFLCELIIYSTEAYLVSTVTTSAADIGAHADLFGLVFQQLTSFTHLAGGSGKGVMFYFLSAY